MTRSALNTLWLTGGGLVATWLAVAPATITPSHLATERPGVAKSAHDAALDNLLAGQTQLRQHPGGAQLGPSTRNPFRFAKAAPAPAPAAVERPAAPRLPMPALPLPRKSPSLTLSGIAEKSGADGRQRTAIIAGEGQLYLATEGSLVAGHYHVLTIDNDVVVLRDENGTDVRLTLK